MTEPDESFSAGSTPTRLAYADTPRRDANRFSVRVVAAIIAAIVVVAGGVTAIGIVSHGQAALEAPLKPPPNGSALPPVPTGSVPPSEIPGDGVGGNSGSEGGPKVDLGEGISLNIASGWKITAQGERDVTIADRDDAVSMSVSVGHTESRDAVQQLVSDSAGLLQRPDISNVQLNPLDTGPLAGQRFQQMAQRGFRADLTTMQGTAHVTGALLDLLNTSTGLFAFVSVIAHTLPAFDAAKDDVQFMLTSLQGPADAPVTP